MTHGTTAAENAAQAGIPDIKNRVQIRGDHPRCYTAKVLVVEYTESQAGGRRGQVAVMNWVAQHAELEHVNYGHPGHMTSLVSREVQVGRDAPPLIRNTIHEARRTLAAYVLFHQVG